MRKTGIVAIVIVIVLIVIGLVYWNTRPTGPTNPEAGSGTIKSPTEGQASGPNAPSGIGQPKTPREKPGTPKTSPGKQAETPNAKPATPAKPSKPRPSQSEQSGQAAAGAASGASAKTMVQQYCQNGGSASQAGTQRLAEQGGLVAIFQNQAALSDTYGCADAYLNHGGKIDAKDPRSDSNHLTPLLFAIQRNDPQMVHYVIDHGADLTQRGGPDNTQPYGFAVYQALHNQATNYNEVISILDSSMRGGKSSASDASKNADQGTDAQGDNSDTGDDASAGRAGTGM